MKTYESFAKHLQTLLGGDKAVELVVDGWMPLSVERIGTTAEGHSLIAMAHTGTQNGDLMVDPEIIFRVHATSDLQVAEPVIFRNDYVGVSQLVYRDIDDSTSDVNVRLKAELRTYARGWFRNLKNKGFFSTRAVRKRLG